MLKFAQDLLIPVAVLTLVLLALNLRSFSKLSGPDRFIWRYISVYAGTEVLFEIWMSFIGSPAYISHFYYLTEAGAVFLIWSWDRLPGKKWLYVLALLGFGALEAEWVPHESARLFSSILVGLMGIVLGFEAVWKGELNWRNMLKFGISIILAHSTFMGLIQRMPFCWDVWFYNTFQLYVLYLSLLRLSFCYYYFVGRNVQMN